MEIIKLKEDMGKLVNPHGFRLSSTKEYEIDLSEELPKQMPILQAVQVMGLDAMRDWWKWLQENGFSVEMPDPTNEFVEKYYGKKPLWETELSQGIVVRNKDDDDFYVVMECTRENEGFKYTQVILTLGGCI